MNFLETKRLSSKRLVHPKMPYLQERIKDNAAAAINYYRGISKYTSNDHVIVRLCRKLLTRFDISELDKKDPYLLVLELNDFAESNSTLLGIGTNYKRGALQQTFYDRDYLYFKELTEPTFTENWKALTPITVMSHPRTDISYKYPEPVDCEIERGMAAIEINLFDLVTMLSGYYEENKSEEGSINYKLFFSRYLFPNMIPSHLDVAFFNRTRASLIGAPKANQIKITGLTLPDIYSYIDSVVEDVSETMLKGRYTVIDVLSNVPLVYHTTLYDKYLYRGETPTTTGRLYTLLSRYMLMSFLLDFQEKTEKVSRLELTDMAKFMRSIVSFNSLSQLNILEPEEEEINAEVIVPLVNQGFKLKLL